MCADNRSSESGPSGAVAKTHTRSRPPLVPLPLSEHAIEAEKSQAVSVQGWWGSNPTPTFLGSIQIESFRKFTLANIHSTMQVIDGLDSNVFLLNSKRFKLHGRALSE